jgi:hypothetical protein
VAWNNYFGCGCHNLLREYMGTTANASDLKAVIALGEHGEPVIDLRLTSDKAIEALTAMSGATVAFALAEEEKTPVERVKESEAIVSEFVTYVNRKAPNGPRFRQYARDPLPAWAADVQPELIDPYAPVNTESLLGDKELVKLIKKFSHCLPRNDGDGVYYVEVFDKVGFAREIIALVAPTHSEDDSRPTPKPYAYEYGRSNGDGTYSMVIDRGDMVKVGPAKYEYGPPKSAVPDCPVVPLFKQPY